MGATPIRPQHRGGAISGKIFASVNAQPAELPGRQNRAPAAAMAGESPAVTPWPMNIAFNESAVPQPAMYRCP